MSEEKKGMDITEILEHLPHRPPFLFVDRILEWEPYKYIKAVKNATINEVFFAGHFPMQPVMPGVLILEALAQAGTVLAFKSSGDKPDEKALYYFAGIDNARFKRVVQPGDQIILEVEITKTRSKLWIAHGKATVNGELVCSADLMSIKGEKNDS